MTDEKNIDTWNDRIVAFRELLARLDEVSIVFTAHDPDAIAAASLLAYLFEYHEVAATVFYCGENYGQQNNAIANFLKFQAGACPISEYAGGPTVLVDSSDLNDRRLGDVEISKDNLVGVIDHHPSTIEQREGIFYLVDEKMGAATTFVAKLLFEMNVKLEDKHPLATVGALAILNDSKSFIRGRSEDWEIFATLRSLASNDDFAKLMNVKLPEDYFISLKDSIEHWKIHQNTALVTGAGWVTPETRDKLYEIADYLLRLKGITRVLVWGLMEDEEDNFSVHLCARSDDLSLNLNTYLKERFGEYAGAKIDGGQGEGAAQFTISRQRGYKDSIARELAFGNAKTLVWEAVSKDEAVTVENDKE